MARQVALGIRPGAKRSTSIIRSVLWTDCAGNAIDRHMQTTTEPSPKNAYLSEHAELLISSYRRFTGRELVAKTGSPRERYRALYEAPYGVVSHGTEDDPVFNYGNLTALRLFEMDWVDFVALPSRESAEPGNRAERQRLLACVSEYGFVDDYRGVRIASTGRRFRIENTTVWNVVDRSNVYRGQAAVFYCWSEI